MREQMGMAAFGNVTSRSAMGDRATLFVDYINYNIQDVAAVKNYQLENLLVPVLTDKPGPSNGESCA